MNTVTKKIQQKMNYSIFNLLEDEMLKEELKPFAAADYGKVIPLPVKHAEPFYDFSAVPDEMKQQKNWVCWSMEERNGKQTKVPKNPKTGGNASATLSGTWATFADAEKYYAAHPEKINGIGYVFTEASGIAGIDIDHCIENGKITSDEIRELVDRCGSYVELSPSGTGLHIYVKGKWNGAGRKNNNLGNGMAIEVYPSARFFTVTGDAFGKAKPLTEEASGSYFSVLKQGAGLADVEAAIADTPTKTFDEAKAVAEKYLNGAGSTLSMDARIQKRYEKAAAEIVAKDAGIDPAVKAKLQATPLDPKAVDEYLAGLDKSIKSIEKAKKTEEILMVAREASAQEYKEKSDKFQDLGSKLQYVQAKDADGNLLYIDADGNTTTTAAGNQPKYATEQAKDPSGKLLYKDSTGAITTDDKDSAGNPNTPIMVPVLVAKDKAALLTDFDEAAKKTEIENGTEIKAMKVAAIDALTISERRAVLKKAGKYGPIRRFFRAFFKLDASDKAIRDAINDPAIDAKKTALLEEAKAGHIEAKTKPMAEEFLKGAPDIKAVQQVYDAEKRSAAIQERMQDGAYEITRNHADISDELIDALDGAAMESVAVAYAFEVLGNDKLKELLKKKGIRAKEADIEEASKQETLSAIVDKSTRNMSTPVIDNPDSPTHTDER